MIPSKAHGATYEKDGNDMKTAVKEYGYKLKFFEIALLIGLAVFLTS